MALVLLSVPASNAEEAREVRTRAFTSCDLQASFEYPEKWGSPVVADHRTDTSPSKSGLFGAAGLDWALRFSFMRHRPFYVTLRVGEFDSDSGLRIITYEGWSDTTSAGELRSLIDRESSLKVDGQAAWVVEEYFEPGGAAKQTTAWFYGDRMYELEVTADVSEFKVKYGRPLGITRLHQQNPDDARLDEFVSAVHELLASFRCAE